VIRKHEEAPVVSDVSYNERSRLPRPK